MSDLSDTPGPPVSQGGSTSTSAADDPGWRAYYEQVQHQHPLAAATSAMLNINGEEGQGQGGPAVSASSGMPPLIYEYYKIPQLAASGGQEKDVWPSTSLNQSVLTSGSLSTSSLLSTSKLSTNQTLLSSLDSAPLHHAPPSLHASQLGDLQSLLYSGAPSGSLLHSGSIVKREPEDLSHRNSRASPTMADCKKSKIVLVGGQGQQQDGLVIDVVNNNNNNNIKDEFSPHNRNGGTTPSSICSDHTLTSAPSGTHPHHMELINTDNIKHTSLYSSMSGSPPMSQYNLEYTTATSTAGQFTPAALTNSSSQLRTLSAAGDSQYYREYFNSTPSSDYATNQVRPGGSYVGDMESTLMERYVRSQQGAAGPGPGAYHTKSVISASGLTVDLPSPDSGIGADTITPRDPTAIHQSFDYSDMCSPANLMGGSGSQDGRVGVAGSPGSNASATNRSRPWHDFGRQNDADKIQIPKLYSPYGFKFVLETPISTNQRREDDRVTYINKGQFYGITMEYIPDPDKPLKSSTVKSIVMLMFREEKSPEDEIKAWQFWHSRQHSVKQRILDADTKNSVGLVGCIEEISHNAIAVYWNPLESPAKINIAVQCLSTDFSSQKGVKGLPLHVQIDTYDDPRDGPVLHRGYVQLKVFCDKGAERKTRDEERRAAKRKMTATGRKKMDELYHPPCERSEFYTMADTNKPPVLFSPAEDIDKIASMELGFYGHEDTSSLSNGETGGSIKHGGQGGGSPFLIHSKPPGTPTPPTLKFHNHFPPDTHSDKKELDQVSMTTDGNVFSSLPLKRPKLMPPLNERVMLYVRQEADEIYTPLHVSPPSTQGLLNADYCQDG
uniref:Protein grainyhead n=1 Tax=Cacopsylla melanoneura TaxID=428564 RepID=A0A8D9AWX6_9HEMI